MCRLARRMLIEATLIRSRSNFARLTELAVVKSMYPTWNPKWKHGLPAVPWCNFDHHNAGSREFSKLSSYVARQLSADGVTLLQAIWQQFTAEVLCSFTESICSSNVPACNSVLLKKRWKELSGRQGWGGKLSSSRHV